MKKTFIFIILMLFLLGLVAEPVIIGEKLTIYSDILQEERSFLIYLPADYNKSYLNYPVLFQIQGSETLFHKTTGEIRYLGEFRTRIPPMLVVNILFTDYRRDIFPLELDRIPGSGGSDDFLDFALTECTESTELQYLLAWQLEANGRLEDAKHKYENCLELNPCHHYARMNRGLLELNSRN